MTPTGYPLLRNWQLERCLPFAASSSIRLSPVGEVAQDGWLFSGKDLLHISATVPPHRDTVDFKRSSVDNDFEFASTNQLRVNSYASLFNAFCNLSRSFPPKKSFSYESAHEEMDQRWQYARGITQTRTKQMEVLASMPKYEVTKLERDIYGHKIIQCRREPGSGYEPVKVMTRHKAGQEVILADDSSSPTLRGQWMNVALNPQDRRTFKMCYSVTVPTFNIPIDESKEVQYTEKPVSLTSLEGGYTFLGTNGATVAEDLESLGVGNSRFRSYALAKYGSQEG